MERSQGLAIRGCSLVILGMGLGTCQQAPVQPSESRWTRSIEGRTVIVEGEFSSLPILANSSAGYRFYPNGEIAEIRLIDAVEPGGEEKLRDPITFKSSGSAGASRVIQDFAENSLTFFGTRTTQFVLTAEGLYRKQDRAERFDVTTRQFEPAEWPKIAPKKDWIEIESAPEDEFLLNSLVFQLSNWVDAKSPRSISPFGLTSNQYFGHVFWDADIWVFPALALLAPESAKAIAAYRLRCFDQARKNAGVGAKFPWESSVSGKETVPGPSKLELHISGDVAFMLEQAASLGLVPNADAAKVKAEVGRYYESVSTIDKSGTRHIPNVMSPDENHVGDDDLFTNCIAEWATGRRYARPRDAQSFLNYENDGLRSYKQTSGLLAIYPLQDPIVEPEARTMIERFAPKVIKNGPAMSQAIDSVIWARLGEREKAYQAWRDSFEPFTKNPFYQFSEKRHKELTFFTTGAGGTVQSALFGMLGFRIDDSPQAAALWQLKLENSKVLSIKPQLPKAWRLVKLKHVSLMGKNYDFELSNQMVKVTSR